MIIENKLFWKGKCKLDCFYTGLNVLAPRLWRKSEYICTFIKTYQIGIWTLNTELIKNESFSSL